MIKYPVLTRLLSRRPRPTSLPKLAHSRMSSSTTTSTEPTASIPTTATEAQKAPLTIEAPPTDSPATQIRVDGEAVKLDALGPMVINVDGTISRINNWHGMTEHEQATTKRLLIRRNEMRRKVLLEKGGKGSTVLD
ncbi:hypothetical protein BJ878DRAFT_497841 [Calycina marina]|uniref:Uncharacterized protein n=1 Tax=Calycina marina TaxID=1763456 RepID=A0A9P7Z6E1_9HELO|nr:hypothetical protein BJ878DRAFT_497841 [Calycina marina]